MKPNNMKMQIEIRNKPLNSGQMTEFLLNNLDAEAIIIDSKSIIRNANNSFLMKNNTSRKEIIGQHCYEFKRCVNKPCLRRNNKCPLKEVFDTNKSVQFSQPDMYLNSYGYYPESPRHKNNFEIHAIPICNGNRNNYGNSKGIENNRTKLMTEIIYDHPKLKYDGKNRLKLNLKQTIKNQLLELFLRNQNNGIYSETLKFILKTMNSNYGILGFIDDDGSLVCPVMSRDIWEFQLINSKNTTIPKTKWEGVWGRALLEKKTFCLNKPFKPPIRFLPIENALITPIIHCDKVIGIIIVGDKESKFNEIDRELLKTMANYFAPVLNYLVKNQIYGINIYGKREDFQKNEQKYHHIYNKAPTLITSLNKDGIILNCNDRIQSLLGYTEEEIIGKPVLDFIHPDFHSNAQKLWCKEPNGIFQKENYKLIKKDGEEIDVTINSSCLEDSNNVFQQHVWFIEDNTETKRCEKRLLKNCNQAKVYLDILGHDINKLNKDITLCSELLLLKPDLSDQYRSHVQNTLNQCGRISNLISNLKRLSELLKDDFKLSTIDVFKVLAESSKRIQQRYHRKNIKLNQSLSESEVLVNSNCMLEDVFINILSNAVKFDEHDEINIDIDHSQSEDGKYWKIELKDNGPGIPDSLKTQIFKGFEIEHKNSLGSGLGLVLVKKIITRNNGRIWVEDRISGDHRNGSNFVLLLPKGLTS